MNRHVRGGVGVVVALLALFSPIAPASADGRAPLPRPVAATGMGLPPWPVPSDTARRAADAGLNMSTMEGVAQHFHTHLDVFVGLERVEVPAELGIDPATGLMADLHTHDTSGVLHVESHAADTRFVLGQLFAMWDVRLDETHLGGLTPDAGHTFRTYVNGVLVTGDPAAIELRAHDQISVMYQDHDVRIKPPASYDFPEGL